MPSHFKTFEDPLAHARGVAAAVDELARAEVPVFPPRDPFFYGPGEGATHAQVQSGGVFIAASGVLPRRASGRGRRGR